MGEYENSLEVDNLLDDFADDLEDAAVSALEDEGTDIDDIAEITDEDIEEDEYDPYEDARAIDDESTDSFTTSFSTDEDIIYEVPEDDEEEEMASDIQDIIDNEDY